MLPGKKYTPEDVFRILLRRIWFILVPVAVVTAATAVFARFLPDEYKSETVILVVPQRVPETYVRSTVPAGIETRLDSISQHILSRTRLERVISDFNLYVEERKTGLMEDVVGRMRSHIKVEIVKGDSFKVTYTGSEPRTVMRVTERLASLFIEENLREREVQADGTNQFLESQLEEARRRLIEHEKKLEDYNRRNSGELPTQLAANMQAMQNIQMQIQAIIESVNRDRDRRLIVERQVADLQAEALAVPAPAQAPTPTPALQSANGDNTVTGGTTAQQLAQARATLQALEARLKPGHPDVGIWRRRLRDLEKQADAEALAAPVTPRVSAADATRERRIRDLKSELEQLDGQIAQKLEEEKRLRGNVATIQARVDATPTRESEMTELTRDYATLQGIYASLLHKKEDSRIAANLERRQIGEQFKLLDPARLPEKPSSPNRPLINLLGCIAGLMIGAGFIVLLEYGDTSFKTDEEVASILSLPVLAVVPSMRSEEERRALFRRRLAIAVGLGTTVTACLAIVAYTFVR